LSSYVLTTGVRGGGRGAEEQFLLPNFRAIMSSGNGKIGVRRRNSDNGVFRGERKRQLNYKCII
jgi:hypothetical protein